MFPPPCRLLRDSSCQYKHPVTSSRSCRLARRDLLKHSLLGLRVLVLALLHHMHCIEPALNLRHSLSKASTLERGTGLCASHGGGPSANGSMLLPPKEARARSAAVRYKARVKGRTRGECSIGERATTTKGLTGTAGNARRDDRRVAVGGERERAFVVVGFARSPSSCSSTCSLHVRYGTRNKCEESDGK